MWVGTINVLFVDIRFHYITNQAGILIVVVPVLIRKDAIGDWNDNERQ